MSDYQRIVDELRLSLQADESELTDELTQLVAEYSEAAKEVNARLRRCARFLSQNLRSEAIQLADTEPNLLDTVSCLDFPEKDRLAELVRERGLRLEPLMLEVAEELNEAYAIEQPLQKLLDKNRLLALARAPLTQRLAVAREIAEQDPNATFWDDDVRELEEARQREIMSEVDSAAAKGDASRLRALRHEMRDTTWLQPPASDFSREVVKRTHKATRNISRNKLAGIADALVEAHVAKDLERARAVARELRAASKQAQTSDDLSSIPGVEPALAWIRDIDAREAAEATYRKELAFLERGIDSGLPRDELKRRLAKIESLGRSIPAELEVRYHKCIEKMARRRLLMLVAIAVGLIVLLVGVVYFVRGVQQRRETKGMKTTAVLREGSNILQATLASPIRS